MNFQRMQISPAKAKEMLGRNPMNRKINQATVDTYAAAMAAGDWDEDSPEVIAVDPGGTLLNGQHRLLAIIKAGVTLKLFVAQGVPKKTFAVLDQGRKRSTGDTFHIKGVNNANQVSAIIKMYLRIKENKLSRQGSDSRDAIYTKQILDVYEKHAKYWDQVTSDAVKYGKDFNSMVAVSILGGFYAMMNDLSQHDAKGFMTKLTTGLNITSAKDPAGQLRKHFMKERTSTKKNSTLYNNAVFIKAWNLFRTKKTVEILTWRKGEPIPKMV